MERLERPKGIIIHHSATRDTDSISYDAIKDYHLGHNNWDDIGYHFVLERVDRKPTLFTGRGVQYRGAHTGGKNDYLGLCVVGNYDKERLSPLMHMELVVFLASQVTYYGFPVEKIKYHNQYSSKTCPGNNFPSIESLREDVKIWLKQKK